MKASSKIDRVRQIVFRKIYYLIPSYFFNLLLISEKIKIFLSLYLGIVNKSINKDKIKRIQIN